MSHSDLGPSRVDEIQAQAEDGRAMVDRVQLSAVAFDRNAAQLAGKKLFMCRHEGRIRTLEEIASSHGLDAALQDKYNLRWLTYYVNQETGASFCLSEAPSREAVEACHREAHGTMLPYRVTEIDPSAFEAHLGAILKPERGHAWGESPIRTILAAALEDPEGIAPRLSDRAARARVQDFERILLAEVEAGGGRDFQRSAGRVFASFGSASRAVETAIAIQQSLSSLTSSEGLATRIGVNAGEPITEGGELFGAAVNVASRVCDAAPTGGILVSAVVRSLTVGKGFEFVARGDIEVPGFGPIETYALQLPADGTAASGRRTPDGLSSREIEVLRLLAAGKSNQQIADSLVISPNTVARHVVNILNKTDLTNRTEAAAYAYRQRLT